MTKTSIIKKLLAFISALVLMLNFNCLSVFSTSTVLVDISIDTTVEKKLISPYIYGINYTDDLSNGTFQSIKQGGSRFTTYNWENNYSNAGSSLFNTNDNYLVSDYSLVEQLKPALGVNKLLGIAKDNNIPYAVTTLSLSDYVSADGNGPILSDQIAPSNRWLTYSFNKSKPLSSNPDINDDKVYADEYINYIISKYGSSTSSTGIRGYALDNNPSEWNLTHPSVFSSDNMIQSFMNKSVSMSKVVKGLDSHAMVFGGQLKGYGAFYDFSGASDWKNYSDEYNWFIDYYLNYMKVSSQNYGKRLLDVLDLYYYSDAHAPDHSDSVVDSIDYSDMYTNSARMQSTRMLWDNTYKEDSKTGQDYQQFIPLIPTMQASINKYYSGTKLAFSEYNFGGGSHISGAIAQADALGIFGKEGVYYAALNSFEDNIGYQKSAFNLYTNYDGNGTGFGNTSVYSHISDNESGSVYAALDNADDSVLRIILINKNTQSKQLCNVSVNSSVKYKMTDAYALDDSGDKIYKSNKTESIENNQFSYTLQPMSIVELVLSSTGETTGIISDDTVKSEITDIASETEKATEITDADIDSQTDDVNPDTDFTYNETTTDNTNEIQAYDPLQTKHENVPLALKIIVIVLASLSLIGSIYLILCDITKNHKNDK